MILPRRTDELANLWTVPAGAHDIVRMRLTRLTIAAVRIEANARLLHCPGTHLWRSTALLGGHHVSLLRRISAV